VVFVGIAGNFADQSSFRRKASPKVAGSVNVSRQGSFCAGQGGAGNPLLTARNSTYYLRRPSFDPAMLSHSLRNSNAGSTTNNIQNGSNNAVNRHSSPSPNRRTSSKPTATSNPVRIPFSRRRSGSISATSTCSESGATTQGLLSDHQRGGKYRRPVTTEYCAVTIEPPSDSSNPVSPDTSPVKSLVTKVRSEQGLKRDSIPGSPGRRKVGFVSRRKKNSLGNTGREFHSLDQIPDESLLDESPLIAPILNKTRKLSKSLDIPEDLTQLIECSKGSGGGRREPYSSYDHSNNKSKSHPRQQYDDVSSLDERAEDSHLLGKSNKENSPCQEEAFHNSQDGGSEDSFDEEDSGVTLEGNEDESTSRKSSGGKVPRNKNWSRKDKRNSGGATVKKWFQNILNGNGMTTGSAQGTTPPAAAHPKATVLHFPLDHDQEAGGKLLVENRNTSGSPCMTEHESVV